MTKRLSIILLLFASISFSSCDTLQGIAGDLLTGEGGLTELQIGNGLKEALEIGITKGAQKLSQKDGYFKSSYKILLPEKARKVTDRLSKVPGFTNIENIMLEKINRGAEDAAKSAAPIFKDAITGMTIKDASNILMGNKDAATRYLEGSTRGKLYSEFNPVIVHSLNKFDALTYWEKAVNTYNKIPFIEKANPKLDDYITEQALNGLFSMVEKKEKGIRTNISERTSDLLQKVFAKQDK